MRTAPAVSPGPVTSRGWRDRAACRGTDPELFFPAAEAGARYEAQVRRAKAVCVPCPVRAQCLAFAFVALPDGVAGGLSAQERRRARAVDTRAGDGARAAGVERVLAGGTRAEVCAAGRAALRAGRAVRQVAREFGVTERTAQRWAHQVRSTG